MTESKAIELLEYIRKTGNGEAPYWVHHDIGTMDNNDAPNYCDNCGQKLDWSE